MWKRLAWVVVLAMATAIFSLPEIGLAMPNYARQSNVSCFTCHSQPAETLGQSASSKNSAQELSLSTGSGIEVGLKAHTAGSEAANTDVSGHRARPVTELYLTKGDDYGRGLSGLSGYLTAKGFYAGLSLFSTEQSINDSYGNPLPLSVWYRFGVTPKVGGLDLALGVFGEMASRDGVPVISASETDDGTDTIGLDAKIRGKIGSMTLDIKAIYLNSVSSAISATNIKSGRTQGAVYGQELSEGFGGAAKLNIRKVFGLSAAYRTYKSKGTQEPSETNLATIGAWVNLSEGITIESQYTTVGENSAFLAEESAFTLLFISSF